MYERKSDPRVYVVENIARLWNEMGIKYVVAHGIEHYPQSLGRDVDIVIDPAYQDSAIEVAVDFLRRQNLKPIVPKKLPWGRRGIFIFAENWGLEIDLVNPPLSVGPITLANFIDPKVVIGPFKIDPWIYFAKRVIMPILAKNLPKSPWLYSFEEESAFKNCKRIFGYYLTRRLLEILKKSDTASLREIIPQLIWFGIVRSLIYSPLDSFLNTFRWAKRKWLLCTKRAVPIVAIVSDRSDKVCSVLNDIKFSHFFLRGFIVITQYQLSKLSRKWFACRDNYLANRRGPIVYVLTQTNLISWENFDVVFFHEEHGGFFNVLAKDARKCQRFILIKNYSDLEHKLEQEIINWFICIHEQ